MSIDSSYIIYSYQWKVDVTNNMIDCYCLNKSSDPVIIHILGYMPPLYITYNNITNYSSLDNLVQYINKILCKESHEIINYRILSMRDSKDITSDITCAVLRFQSWEARRHCHNLLNMKTFKHYKNTITVLNTEINDVILFLADNDLDTCGWIETSDLDKKTMMCTKITKLNTITPLFPVILSFDIECNSSNTNRMPRSHNIDDKIIMISAVHKRYGSDDNNLISKVFVLDISDKISYNRDNIIKCDSEEHIIEEFLKHIVLVDPLIIVGFNNFGFDIPYIIGRLHLRLRHIPIDISRNTSGTSIREIESSTKAYGYIKGTSLTSNGRILMDLLTIFRRDNKLKVRSLDEVSRIFLEDKKANMSHKEMFKIFSNPTSNDMTRIIDYCIKDSTLVIRLIDKLDMWTTWTEESSITFTSIDDLYIRGITHRATNMFYRECVKNNIIVRKHNIKRYKTLGGHVFEPIIGLYNNCTCVDYRSLYPSIIIEHNICLSTYRGTSDNGEHIFLTEPRGIIPDMLVSLVNKRKDILQRTKEEQDTRIKSILNARQMSLKLSANGIYGVLSTPYDHILCFSPAAETVTSLGRKYINTLSDILRNTYKFTCIYGDTDSCYITKNNLTKEELIDETNKAINEINNTLPTNINIAFERHVDTMFIISKKKYVLVANGKMIHKGNVSIRKDNCELVRRLYSNILDMALLKQHNINTLKLKILYIYDKLINGLIDIDDLVVTCPVNKGYRSKSNQYYIMIERLRRNGTTISVNDRIAYLFVETDNDDCLQGYKMYTYDEVIENGYKIDYMYYLHRKVHPVIGTLLDLLGYNYISNEIINNILPAPKPYTRQQAF